MGLTLDPRSRICFFLTFPELKVDKLEEVYVPRIFGYRLHKSAYREALEARKKEKKKKPAGGKANSIQMED